MCGKNFKTSESLQNHIGKEHDQEPSLSLISEASSGWMDESSRVIEKESQKDQTSDLDLEELLMEHQIEDDKSENILSEHENPPIQTQKRIVQNLRDVKFDDDSDEDNE
jgi:hypothetical protein